MLRKLAIAAATASGALMAVAWVITQQILHPKPRVEDHDLGDFGLAAEDVSFLSRDGNRLSGWFIPAPGGARAPGFVLSHGWARSRAELLPHADILHRAGYAVLMYDQRNRGKSEGDSCTLGLREQEDLRGAIDYAFSRPEFDTPQVGLYGMSTGSVVSIVVAADDLRIRVVVAECPFASQDAVIVTGIKHYSNLPAFPLATMARWLLRRRVGSDNSADAVAHVGRISPRPIFIMADERDAVVGTEDTPRVFAAAGEPKRFWLIPDADHARGWQAAPEEYERQVLEFLREHLPIRDEQTAYASS